MKKGEKMTEEHKAKMLAAAATSRANRAAEKAAHPEVVAQVDAGKVAIGPGIVTPVEIVANGHPNVLDIADPLKWQMKVRMHLMQLEAPDAEKWMDGIRLVSQMAGNIVRTSVYTRVTNRCFVCDKPFPDNKPAGEAGYMDADRQYIKVYCCNNAHYGKMLEMCMEKEAEIARWAEKTDKAVQQAMTDARSAARKQMPA